MDPVGVGEGDCLTEIEDEILADTSNWIKADETLRRSTFLRPDAPTARARTARSTPSTRSHNTRPERYDEF
jgi:hypothetical protein